MWDRTDAHSRADKRATAIWERLELACLLSIRSSKSAEEDGRWSSAEREAQRRAIANLGMPIRPARVARESTGGSDSGGSRRRRGSDLESARNKRVRSRPPSAALLSSALDEYKERSARLGETIRRIAALTDAVRRDLGNVSEEEDDADGSGLTPVLSPDVPPVEFLRT